jgi:hypothetical protein
MQALAPQVLEQIARAIRSLRFGTVHVTVHEGRVVQIEKLERVRVCAADRTLGRSTDESPSDQSPGGSWRTGGR